MDKGARVALFDRNADVLAQVKAELVAHCATFVGDICNFADLESAMTEAVKTFFRIDAVFTNAGIECISPLISIA